MNTRVAVPLTQEAYDAVSFLAKLGGVSRGRFLADVVEVAVPSFIALEAAYKAVLAAEGEERAQLLEGMKEAERQLMASLAEVLPSSSRGVDGAPGARSSEGGERASGEPSDPHYTNRGVHNLSDEGRGE